MQDQGKNKGVMSSILTELGVLRPEGSSDEALTVDQQEIIAAFRTGRMTEEEFRKHLSQDPGLSNHLSQIMPVTGGYVGKPEDFDSMEVTVKTTSYP